MVIIYRVAIELLDVVDHHLRARQDQTPTMSNIPQDTGTTTDSITTPSQTSNMIGGQQSGGPTSSPLLFFVALGFGVVFTNLWIIVGVKYCFRYNARNRAMRSGNDIDPINLDNLHARPHRRRREKKLMTMDEVNERFPLTKYKSWAASRAREGLPTSGGVSRPLSRVSSERDTSESLDSPPVNDSNDSNSSETKPKTTDLDIQEKTSDVATSAAEVENEKQEVIEISEKKALSTNELKSSQQQEVPLVQNSITSAEKKSSVTIEDEDDDDDEDDQINTAVSPELLSGPGDSCAICIDTLEEEDEVRGLSCGHAFHAGCLDPWLTSRRACCPLCKADFYIPKARSEAENAEADRLNRSDGPLASQHQSIWNTILASSRLLRSRPGSNGQPPSQNSYSTNPFSVNSSSQIPSTVPRNEASQSRMNEISSISAIIRNLSFPAIHLPRRNRLVASESTSNPPSSPSQLEAGVRR